MPDEPQNSQQKKATTNKPQQQQQQKHKILPPQSTNIRKNRINHKEKQPRHRKATEDITRGTKSIKSRKRHRKAHKSKTAAKNSTELSISQESESGIEFIYHPRPPATVQWILSGHRFSSINQVLLLLHHTSIAIYNNTPIRSFTHITAPHKNYINACSQPLVFTKNQILTNISFANQLYFYFYCKRFEDYRDYWFIYWTNWNVK